MPKRYDPTTLTSKAWETVVRELQAERDRYADIGATDLAKRIDAVIQSLRAIWGEF